jgi:TolB-like protein/tetratricopeptide (TPR) repeat protein
MSANREPLAGKRLDSWKEIAAFLGRAERTVKRWETERGLPVHRVPGGGRSAVFAYSDELADWLKGRSEDLDADDSPSGGVANPNLAEAAVTVSAPPAPVTIASTAVPAAIKNWPASRLAAWLVPFLLAAGLITYFSIGHSEPHYKALASRQPANAESSDLYLGPDSIAVLPFTNERGDANTAYLSDGIAESLIGNLARVPQLKVRSRDSAFRYKGKDLDVRTIGNNLGVSAVVSGRVMLRGDTIEISTELTDVRDNTEIWGHRYTGKSSNLISMQQQIAGDIAGKLRSKLSSSERQHVIRQGTQNPEAYELYLKGRYAWNNRTYSELEKAISDFNQAITNDPAYALAYSGLADAYAVLPNYGGNQNEDFPKSNAAARKALELDPTLAHPHAVLGSNEIQFDWDFAAGEAEFKKSFELDPNDATAHQWYGDEIGQIGGREQESFAQADLAHELDPLSPVITRVAGGVRVSARKFDEGIAICRKLANDNPTFAVARDCLAQAYWGKRMYPQVIEERKAYGQLTGHLVDVEFAAAMEQGFRSSGWPGALTQSAEFWRAQRKTGYVSAFEIATFYSDLGDKEQAFHWLNLAYQEHDWLLITLNTNYALDPIRSDPRFVELVRKVGLPQ